MFDSREVDCRDDADDQMLFASLLLRTNIESFLQTETFRTSNVLAKFVLLSGYGVFFWLQFYKRVVQYNECGNGTDCSLPQ